MSVRTRRVAKLMRREIAEILARDFPTPTIVTVTGVRITSDLSIANIDLSIMDDSSDTRREIFESMVNQIPAIRKSLAVRVRHQMRAIPTIRFFLDDSQEHIQKIDALFEKINQRESNP